MIVSSKDFFYYRALDLYRSNLGTALTSQPKTGGFNKDDIFWGTLRILAQDTAQNLWF